LDKARSLPLVVPGVILVAVGIPLPTMNPGQPLLLELRAL
jgi:hypothetical protein